LQVIEQNRPTFFFSVPTLYARFLRVEKRYDLSSLRICLSSGEPLPPAIFHQWKEKFGLELLDVVGSTEATHDFLANRPGKAKPGSSGQVTPAFEAKIVDDKYPRWIDFVEDLPKTVTGKIQRFKLRDKSAD
jgi:acyl-coenzyme A synthetase/AMP-(fatty) acid ligase